MGFVRELGVLRLQFDNAGVPVWRRGLFLPQPTRHGFPFQALRCALRVTRLCPEGADAIVRRAESARCVASASVDRRRVDDERPGPVTQAKSPDEQYIAQRKAVPRSPQSRRLGLHARALRPARLAAEPAFLDPGSGYPGQHQAGDRQ